MAGPVFDGTTTPATQLDHVRIEYAGGGCSCNGFGCPPNSIDDASIVILDWAPTVSFLTNSTIAHGRNHGVLRGWHADVGADFKPTNTFDVGICAQTMYRTLDPNQVCPAACQ